MTMVIKKLLFLNLCCVTITNYASENTQTLLSLEDVPVEISMKYIFPDLELSDIGNLSITSKFLFHITKEEKVKKHLSSFYQISRNFTSNKYKQLSENFGWKEGFYALWHIGNFYMPYLYEKSDLINTYIQEEEINENCNSILSINEELLLETFSDNVYEKFINEIVLKRLHIITEENPSIAETNLDLNSFFKLEQVEFTKDNFINYPFNFFDKYGYTALMYTALYGKKETVKELIAAGANLDIQNEYSNTALMMAAWNEKTKIVKELIVADANPDIQNKHGYTALILAYSNKKTEIVNELIAAGANPDIQNEYSSTALMLAALYGKTETVKELIDAGANPDIQDQHSSTALDLAKQKSFKEIIELLENS